MTMDNVSTDSGGRGLPAYRRRTLAAVGVVAAIALTALVLPQEAASGAWVACPASVTVPEKTSARFYPPLVAGDREFEGHGPSITVSAKRELWEGTTDVLLVVVKMRAEETQSDWTRAEGTQQTFTLYQAPTGCGIDASSVPYGNFDSNGYLARAAYPNPYPLPAGDPATVNKSFVLRYSVWDDRAGTDVVDYTSVTVTTRSFTVRLTS